MLFFNDVIRRKVASLLHPWLLEEPESEVRLGFFHSHLIFKNLSFDASALNLFIEHSTNLLFDEVRVESLTLRISNWSFPAFSLHMNGVHITLRLRGMEEESRVKKSNTCLVDKNKILSQIDPEGTVLHGVLEKIVGSSRSRNQLKNSFWNVLLRHFRLQIHDFHLQLRFSILDDHIKWLSEIKEFTIESDYRNTRCIILRLAGALISPLRKCSFNVDSRGFEVALEKDDHLNSVLAPTNAFCCIKFKDLQLIDLNLHVPELFMSFSPDYLPIVCAFQSLLSRESKNIRSGKHLWRIAADRLATRMSVKKVVGIVCLWLHLVNDYHSLLFHVGYPAEKLIRRKIVEMSRDNKFSRYVKHLWQLVSEHEKKLPVEAVARARRIARHRASLNVGHAEEDGTMKLFPGILSLLKVLWGLICWLLLFFVQKFSVRSFSRYPDSDEEVVDISDSCCAQSHFSISLGKISFTISPCFAFQPPLRSEVESSSGISPLDLMSLCVSINAFSLLYDENIYGQSFFLSSGHLKVMSSSSKEERDGEWNTVLWVEPALMISPVENTVNGSADGTTGQCIHMLEKNLGEMRFKWRRFCSKFRESKILYSEEPWLLCNTKSSFIDQYPSNSYSGLWKCCLTVGKLNFAAPYLSLVSIFVFHKQIQHAFYWNESNENEMVLLRSSSVVSGSPKVDLYRLYSGLMWKTMLRMIPERHIQVAILIDGFCIRIPVSKERFDGGNKDQDHTLGHDDLFLVLNVHTIEIVTWPTLDSDTSEHDELRLRKPQIITSQRSDDEMYISTGQISLGLRLRLFGLDAYMEETAQNQQLPILVSKPINVNFSSLRFCLHSFSTSRVGFSAAFHWLAMGFDVLLCLNELSVIFQVVDLFSSVSEISTSFNSTHGSHYPEFCRRMFVSAASQHRNASGGSNFVSQSTEFLINGTFEIKSVNVILHNARKSSMEKFSLITDDLSILRHDVPDYGIWMTVQSCCSELSFEEEKLEALADLLGVQFVIFQCQSQKEGCTTPAQFRNSILHTFGSLYETSFSSCSVSLRVVSPQNASSTGSLSNLLDESTDAGGSPLMTGSSSLTIGDVDSNTQPSNSGQLLKFTSNSTAEVLNQWLCINITFSEIFMVGCSVKQTLAGLQQSKKFLSSLSIGPEFQKVSWQVQGGLVFLEPSALRIFERCIASYAHYCRILIPLIPPWKKQSETAELGHTINHGHFCEEQSSEVSSVHDKASRMLLEAFTLEISQFFLGFVVAEESGCIWEFFVGLDACLNLNWSRMRWKLLLDLSSLSILSQVHEIVDQRETETPHFSSFSANDIFSRHGDEISSVPKGEILSSPFLSTADVPKDTSEIQAYRSSGQNYIMKKMTAFISIEKPIGGNENDLLGLNQIWVGRGSVSGFDMTISLSELQMLLSVGASFSEVSDEKTTSCKKQANGSFNQELDNYLEETVRDGAIVAIQDVHQHLYLTVGSMENKYSLTGVMHYSLVGDRALFRVRYQKQRRWSSPVSWFSLVSLHAKTSSGEPLRLSCRSGSGFVDITGTSDSSASLWRTLPHKPENFEGDSDRKLHNNLARGACYLLNKKNDCSIAFLDGYPEFVKKPGNPFKFKVFLESSEALVFASQGGCLAPFGTHVQHEKLMKNETDGLITKAPCIDVMINKVSLTIVQGLSGARENYPLLQGCAEGVQIINQILTSKVRVMSTSRAILYYFDAHRNMWRELVHPVEVSIFYRSRLQNQRLESSPHVVSLHLYCRIKEVGIALTEISLDILLFVIGELNLAGPFSVRTSEILASCCKVENHTGVDLLCHCYGNQDATIARKQSASIFLRDLTSADQAPQNALFSIQLAVRGTFLTSPVHLSLLEAQTRAWRMRILSQHDSRTYPGPFIVVDISRKAEDGLSIAVSPLLRVHNETEFAMELRFQRPQVKADFASILLNAGDMIDDCMAVFDAVGLSGGSRKALMSLTVGNFLYSFRPQITDALKCSQKIYSVEWSGDLKGGKAVRISGVFDKLSYTIRKAFSVEPFKYSFSCACCSVKFEDASVGSIHFMIQTIVRDIPVMQPDSSGNTIENTNAAVALQVQKEIFLFPTVRVTNLLQSEIYVLLSETDLCSTGHDKIGKEATIVPGSKVNFYANPSIMYFMVTITAFNSSCKPVNSGEWVKKLQKRKSIVNSLDINLEFGVGKYFATLRLYRGDNGILEAVIFTSYTLKNDTDFPLICLVPNLKILPREEVHKFGFSLPPEVGVCLAPNSMASWFAKYSKVILKLLEGKSSEKLLDLDTLSGLTEISLEMEGESGTLGLVKLGAAVGPSTSKEIVPSQIVTMVPRYVVCNESEETVIVRQCYLENDMEGMIYIKSKQKTALQLHKGSSRREISPFDNFVRKHRTNNDSVILIQFRLDKTGLDWSGPVCIASLGRFFLKFRRSSDFRVEHSHDIRARDDNSVEFAVVQVAEEGSSIVSHFYRSPNITLPYRIENLLHSAITYYQKDSLRPETLKPGSSLSYVWDDLTLPHRLIVHIDEMHLLREINLDKVRAWKPFHKSGQKRGLGPNFLFDKTPRVQKTMSGEVRAPKVANVGYEVYADGSTRVLKVCELDDSGKVETIIRSCTKVRFRVSSFTVSLMENQNQAGDATVPSDYTTITVARLGKLSLNSVLMDHLSYYQISMQSLNVDQKWVGAPFPSMLHRHRVDHSDATDNILSVILILQSTTSKIMHVKHLSIILQPIDLNLDEETLMRVVPFWRRSLSDANGPSVQFYFDHFEIHPIKITANFLPGDSFASYSSAQETLRSLLHSVIKIPTIRNMVVELNGVLVTHALVTTRELLIKCAQHYSWYALRAIYIAKGSPLLPPSFVSVFDDLASSSLDVFFDPSSGSINLPGLSIGTFKFISKCIDMKGFSGTKRYFGDLGKTLRTAGSNVLFAAVTEISDSVLKGAEASGFKGMLTGFHQGILRLAMEPSMLQTAFMEGGPERKIKLDQSAGVDELYIEGYLQAMLDAVYSQEYLRVRVIDNEVVLKNLPPSSSLIDEIMNRVKDFLVSKGLLKGDSSTTSRPLRHLRGASEWKIGPTVVTLCEHLFVSFAIRILRKQASKFMGGLRLKALPNRSDDKATVMASNNGVEKKPRTVWKWGIGKFALSGIVAYVDGRLCRCIPHPLARRIVSGFFLSFLDNNNDDK